MPKKPNAREKKQRVKTAASRTKSSNRWLERHLNDPYVHEATRQGYRSRAAFKLIEIDEKAKILKPHLRVVDLGAAPGGWSQIVSMHKPACVVAIDCLPMEPLEGVTFLQMDFTDNQAPDALKAALKGGAHLVLSDLSPNTTGHKQTDHLRMMALVEMAWAFASEVLEPGGAFVAKVFQGGTQNVLLASIKPYFESIKHIKPPASRKESSEVYLLCQGFKQPIPPA